jgi:hypothetical protein
MQNKYAVKYKKGEQNMENKNNDLKETTLCREKTTGRPQILILAGLGKKGKTPTLKLVPTELEHRQICGIVSEEPWGPGDCIYKLSTKDNKKVIIVTGGDCYISIEIFYFILSKYPDTDIFVMAFKTRGKERKNVLLKILGEYEAQSIDKTVVKNKHRSAEQYEADKDKANQQDCQKICDKVESLLKSIK